MQAMLLRPEHHCLHKAPAHVPLAVRRMNIPALKERDRARIASVCIRPHADLSKTNHTIFDAFCQQGRRVFPGFPSQCFGFVGFWPELFSQAEPLMPITRTKLVNHDLCGAIHW